MYGNCVSVRNYTTNGRVASYGLFGDIISIFHITFSTFQDDVSLYRTAVDLRPEIRAHTIVVSESGEHNKS